jgi:nucleoporin NDC1
VRYYLLKESFMVFPSIQQHKLFRLRGHVTSHVREALTRTLGGLRYFYPLYFLLGYYPRNRVIRLLGLQLRDDVRLTSLSSLMDLGLFTSLLVAGTTIHVGWSFGLRIFRTFQTQAVQFPVVATFSGDRDRTLAVSLTSRASPLVRCLGFLDLHQLALHSHSRRAEVFSLDVDGKPEVWEVVSRECLALVHDLTSRLTAKEGRVSTAGPASSSPPPSSASPTAPSPTSSLNGGSPAMSSEKGWHELPAGVLAPPGVSRRMASSEKTRLWSYSPPGLVETQTTPPAPPKPHPRLVEVKKRTGDNLTSLLKRTRDNLRNTPFFHYFLSEFPGAKSQELFFDSKLQVWAITGISQLAVTSYTEDQYGVVQRTLPHILSTLIVLSKEMDRHVKAPLSNAKSTRDARLALEMNGKFAVKTAVQTSLHSLAVTFIKEMRSLQLTEEQVTYWNQFMGTRQDNSQSALGLTK